VAIAAIALAYALPTQSVGCAQSAHYAAIRSIAQGDPTIDRYANETCDLVKVKGHYYAAKGPALDLWSAPYYLVLHALHAVPRNPNARSRTRTRWRACRSVRSGRSGSGPSSSPRSRCPS
jgi:hypothetical protein